MGPEAKKVLHFMTTLYNFDFKLETRWAKRVLKSILETRNANDVSILISLSILG